MINDELPQKLTDKTLAQQLKISEQDVNRRLQLLYLSSADFKQLTLFKPEIADRIEEIVEKFYDGQTQFLEIDALIGDAETLARLKKHMRTYVLNLFDGVYDIEYVQGRLRIGMIHNRIGVAPKLYISGVWNLQSILCEIIREQPNLKQSRKDQLTDCVTKLLLFDLSLVMDTYIHSLTDELDRGRQEIEDYATSLEITVQQRIQELADQARVDGMTGLLNHRSFYDELRRELSRSQRKNEGVSLLYFDLDGFKQINDRFGHQKGDEILIRTADVVRQVARGEDILARYGGDEFCIILPHTSMENAKIFAHRLIERFAEEMEKEEVTLSVGIASTEFDALADCDTLIRRADQQMYRAKKKLGHYLVCEGDG